MSMLMVGKYNVNGSREKNMGRKDLKMFTSWRKSLIQ